MFLKYNHHNIKSYSKIRLKIQIFLEDKSNNTMYVLNKVIIIELMALLSPDTLKINDLPHISYFACNCIYFALSLSKDNSFIFFHITNIL